MTTETQTQIPPQTTVTSSPPPSDWLTRLRTSKGFTDDSTYTNLEHFLSTSLPQSPPTPIPTPHADVTIQPLPQHDVITNVLSDLFCFGKPTNQTSKPKTSRKQTNPKPCVSAKNSLVSSSPKVRTSRKQIRPELCLSAKKAAKVRECVEEGEWEEDFRGFTETEVTVIDTSVARWKFDKVLYRRNNVWRVGDVNVNRKRKDGGGDGEINMNKKKKLKLKLCGVRDKENGEKMKKKKNKLKFVQEHDQGKAMAGTSEKKQDNCSQVQEKRVLQKQIESGSSVILIKSIPITNKKDMSGISKSCVKLQK